MGPTLLLTATITPPLGVPSLTRTDPAARLQDHLSALDFYLNLPNEEISRVVFVENSASDLSALRRLAGRHPEKEVEFIGFYGLDYPTEYGRSYGEHRLMDYAFDHSELIARLQPDDRVWKATGRLRLLNLGEMIVGAPADYELYCDLRNRNLRARPYPWMDMRFYSFTPRGYHRLLREVCHRVRVDVTGNCGEITLRSIIGEHLDDPLVVPRFRTQPLVSGISGTYNMAYDGSIKHKTNYIIRRVLRRTVPGLWV